MLKTLEGVRVIDFGLAAAGPSCSKILAEYGAEVIVVEPTWGTTTRWMCYYYDFWSNGKKSVPIDVKSEEGLEVFKKIIASADVFLSNYREKALIKSHLTYKELKQINPNLIYARLYGWGAKGPLKDSPAYDITAFWARGGYNRDVAEKGSVCVAPQAVADASMGEILASGICAALYHREKTGEGCEISTSIYAQAIYLNNFQNINVQFGEEYPKSRKEPREALVNTYLCSDGYYILMFDNQFDRHFWDIMRAIGREDLVGDARWNCISDTKLEKAPELAEILEEAFSKMTSKEAVEALAAVDVSAEICWGSADTLTDPQALENDYYFDWTLSSGEKAGETIKMPATPIAFNGENNATDFVRAPRLGEHTEEILKSVGYGEEEIKNLAQKGAIVVE